MTIDDTVVRYWTDYCGELWYHTQKGYCGKWNDSGWTKLPLPPGCKEENDWIQEASVALSKLKELQVLLAQHREKQYYCRTQADESLWKETLETLFEEETK